MNKSSIERGLAALLFVMVLVIFSLAERDSRKLRQFYASVRLPVHKPVKQPLAFTATPLLSKNTR